MIRTPKIRPVFLLENFMCVTRRSPGVPGSNTFPGKEILHVLQVTWYIWGFTGVRFNLCESL